MNAKFRKISENLWASKRYGLLYCSKRFNLFWVYGSRKARISYHCLFNLKDSDFISLQIKDGYLREIANQIQTENAWIQVEDIKGFLSLKKVISQG